jgi:hypothetical protein
MFDVMERYGGPCILHDSRLTQIYHLRLGRERFSAWARQLLKTSFTGEDIDRWLQDQDPPSLFVEPIVERAEPLIVHSQRYCELLRKRYGKEAVVTTFPPNMLFTEEDISPQEREAARNRLGLPPDQFLVATFGYVSPSKGITPPHRCARVAPFMEHSC